MRRVGIVILLFIGTLWVLPVAPADALSLPVPPKPRQLTVSGFVVGRVAKGNLIRFGVLAFDPEQWFHLRTVKVVLLLHGQPLQEMTFFVKEGRFKLGDSPAVSTGSASPLVGGFFRVNPHTVRRIRSANGVRVTFWARVRDAVPRGTTFRVIARDEAGNISYARERVSVSGSFLTWGTFTIGLFLALLLGAFITNLRLSRRLREREPSIWDILERRLRDEPVRPPTLVGALASGATG